MYLYYFFTLRSLTGRMDGINLDAVAFANLYEIFFFLQNRLAPISIYIAGISNSFVVYKQCVHIDLPAAKHAAKELRSVYIISDHSSAT